MRVAAEGSRPTYGPEILAELDHAAHRHFWFRHRNRVLAELLRSRLGHVPIPRILEVGCGTGGVLAEIERTIPRAELIGVDLFPEAIDRARRNTRATLIAGDLATIDVGRDLDAACAFDVIEHLDDDIGTLRRLASVLRPTGGLVAITVPAHDWLWTELDDATFHRRRYSMPSLIEAFRRAGLRPVFTSYLMSAALVPLWLRRVLVGRRRQPKSGWVDELQVPPVLNQILLATLAPERRLLAAGRSMPFGSSLLGIAVPDTAP